MKSQNLVAKLNYQRSFEIETNELHKQRDTTQVVVQNEPIESIEVESQLKNFTLHEDKAQIKAKTKKSNLKQHQQNQLNSLNLKLNQQTNGDEFQQNW
jgi:hypothetical protein